MKKPKPPADPYREVDLAAGRIRRHNQRVYDDWIVVGSGLMKERVAVLRRIGNRRNPLQSFAFRQGMGDWLRGRSLDTQFLLQDGAVRANLAAMMENIGEVSQWRDKLSPVMRHDLNHPTAIMRNFRKAQAEADPERAEKKAKMAAQPSSREQLREAQKTISTQAAHIEDIESGRSTTPRTARQFIDAIRDECSDDEIREIADALAETLKGRSEGRKPGSLH